MVSLEAYHFCFLIFMMNQKSVISSDLGDYVVMRNWWAPTNYKEWKVAQDESSFSFWIKLSTFISLVFFLRTCFYFHDDVRISYALIKRILVVYIMISQISLCWRVKVLIRILRWVVVEYDEELKGSRIILNWNYFKRDGAWDVYLWGMSFVVGWEWIPLWALHENYDWYWFG